MKRLKPIREKTSYRKANYVCATCRTTSKSGNVCPRCRNERVCVGYRWRIPKKNNDREWKKLVEQFKKQFESNLKERWQKHQDW